MAADIKPGWSKPSTILFAAEFPANEKAFGFALSQAMEFGAELIIFHVFDRFQLPEGDATPIQGSEYAAVRAVKSRFEDLCRRAKDLGVQCRVIIRKGWAVEQILSFLHELSIDRIVMGAHSPGPVGKLLVGSVAEAVMRNTTVPVCIVGPHVAESSFRNRGQRTILCDVSQHQVRRIVANLGAELAMAHKASLILHSVISPQEREEVLMDRTIDQLESELPSLLRPTAHKRGLRTRVVFGDPIEELLYQGRSQQVHLIVIGAQGASQFAAVSRAGTVYKILAYAQSPVMVLSPVLLAEFGAVERQLQSKEVHYMAGVI